MKKFRKSKNASFSTCRKKIVNNHFVLLYTSADGINLQKKIQLHTIYNTKLRRITRFLIRIYIVQW